MGEQEVEALTPDQWALVTANLDLVPMVLRRWFNPGRWDDLFSAGQWGLIVAAATWAGVRGKVFRRYAVTGIRRGMLAETWKIALRAKPLPPPEPRIPEAERREEIDHLLARLPAAGLTEREWDLLAAMYGIGREEQTLMALAGREDCSSAKLSLVVVGARAKLKAVLDV